MVNVLNMDFDIRNPMAQPRPTALSPALDRLFQSDHYEFVHGADPQADNTEIVFRHKETGAIVNYTASFSGYYANITVDVSEKEGGLEAVRLDVNNVLSSLD